MALELLTNMRPGGTSLGPLPRHLLRTPAACIPQEVQAMGMCPGASAVFLTFPVPIPLACVSPSTVSPEHWAGAVMMKATGRPVPLSRCWGRKIQVQTQAKSSSRKRGKEDKAPMGGHAWGCAHGPGAGQWAQLQGHMGSRTMDISAQMGAGFHGCQSYLDLKVSPVAQTLAREAQWWLSRCNQLIPTRPGGAAIEHGQ